MDDVLDKKESFGEKVLDNIAGSENLENNKNADLSKVPENNEKQEKAVHPFLIMVNKEISDHVSSWRFIILVAILALTCAGSVYIALTNMGNAVKPNDPEGSFFFLKLFTISDGTLPPFFVFIALLGPLLGIGLGFDAVNTEHNKGTLSRIMAQPVHRDYLINAKFVAALIVIGTMFFALGFMVTGIGIFAIGIPPTVDEFLRIISFLLLSVFYVAFWLNLSIFFSVQFRQAATSALSAMAIWLFFSVFYPLLMNMIDKATAPSVMANAWQVFSHQKLMTFLNGLSPSQLFSDATTILLVPSVRSVGPLMMEQMYGAIPSPLSIGQSLLVIWPQLTGLVAATVICFSLSYVSFMRKEIRSR